MNTRELRQRLRKLGHYANAQFPHLNYGGCCVFAAAVAKELERAKVQHEVIVPCPYNGDADLNEIRAKVSNVNNKEAWNMEGVYFSHVAVRLKIDGRWHTYDSDSFHRSKYNFGENGRYTAPNGGMTAKEATALANEARGWSRCFNRKDVPAVRRLVREVMRGQA